jgi:hypothetical protein
VQQWNYRQFFRHGVTVRRINHLNHDAVYTFVYPQNLPPGVRPRIRVTHEAGYFNSKVGVRHVWVRNDHMTFYEKGRGTGMMVSEYLTPGGNLQLPPDYPVADYPLEPDGECNGGPITKTNVGQ